MGGSILAEKRKVIRKKIKAADEMKRFMADHYYQLDNDRP